MNYNYQKLNISNNITNNNNSHFTSNDSNTYGNLTDQIKNSLNQSFFSKENIQIIQNNIRKNVWLQTDKKNIIGNQSEEELIIVMRSTFLQYSKNNDNNITQQIRELNKLVCDWCINEIITQIKQYVGFVNNLDKNVIPLEYGMYMSNAGTKSLNLEKFII